MTATYTIRLIDDKTRQRAHKCVDRAPDGYTATFAEESRTKAQNRLLHPLIRHVTRDGELVYERQTMTQDEWRRLFVVTLKTMNGQRVKLVPTIDGSGLVDVTDGSSSGMGKRAFSELIDYVVWFGDEFGEPVPAEMLRPIHDSGEYTPPKREPQHRQAS